jgi:serine/threonine protein kinase/WD40 repeat protein
VRERDLFIEALQKENPGERAAFLGDACAGDDGLRARVDRLLEEHQRQESFLLDSPPPGLAATMEQSVSERPGTVIGSYKLLEQIGEGGFGVVYMAEQTQPVRRKVALKILKPGMDTRQVVARFEAERQALALMDHPNIAHVYDGGETASGRPYFVMELVRGTPIIDFCDQKHLSVRERLDLFVNVCQAVQHAHLKGIIHRDLKPSNVMVTMHDSVAVVKVIDFGIAKATGQQLTEKTLFTNFAQLVGTPMYMSPEQAQLSGLDVDTRSDIYALGVLLYELLTGTTPFDQERLRTAAYDEIRRIISEEEPPRPSTRMSCGTPEGQAATTVSANRQSDPFRLRQMLRGDLDWIVMKCLEKERNRRYETASGLAADIQRYLCDRPVEACPPSAMYKLRKFARRNTAALAMVAMGSAALFTIAVVACLAALWLRDERNATREQLRLTEEAERQERQAKQRALQAEKLGQHRLYQAKLAQARASHWSQQVGQRFDSWQALTEAALIARELGLDDTHLMELRNEAISSLALADLRLVHKEWVAFPAGARGHIAFDFNLECYARSDSQGNISVRRVENDRELARLPGASIAITFSPNGSFDFKEISAETWSSAATSTFSPNATLLAIRYWSALPGQTANFRLWDWQRRLCLFQPTFFVREIAFSSDGRYLSLGHDDGTVTIHELPSGREEKRMSIGMRQPVLAFDQDGLRLAVSNYGGRDVQIRDVITGEPLQTWNAPAGVVDIAWHPDGLLLATGCDDRRIYLWDSRSGLQFGVLLGHQNSGFSLAFAPTGLTLLSSAWDGTSRLWDPWAARELLSAPGFAEQFSGDGCRLVRRNGISASVWEVAPGRECRTLPSSRSIGSEGLGHGDVSPDGRWLAIGTSHGFRLWDLALGKEAASVGLSYMKHAKFHPSGKELFTCGPAGLYVWPLRAEADLLHIGPACKLPEPSSSDAISLDRDGRIIAVASSGSSGGGWIADLENTNRNGLRVRHVNSTSIAISPDGRWVALGPHEGSGVKVWEARTGEELCHLIPDVNIATVAFSPDSRRLAIGTGNAVTIWEAGSWKLIRQIPREQTTEIPATSAFSPGGQLLAFTSSLSTVQLLEPATGSPVAKLQGPDSDIKAVEGFSPDGSQLALTTQAGAVRVWDLRLIREQLQEIGLDWDLPPYPPSMPPGDAQPMRVEIDLGEFPHLTQAQAQQHLMRGQEHWMAMQWREAIAQYSEGIELQPNNPAALNNLAWCLVTCPDPQLRDVARAVRLAQKATELAPQDPVTLNTLGVVYYYAGDWTAAIVALQKSEQLEPGRYFSFNAFFLAMAHWQLGNREIKDDAAVVEVHEQHAKHQAEHNERARQWFDQAVEWMEKNKPLDEELRAFRREAEELLELKEQEKQRF